MMKLILVELILNLFLVSLVNGQYKTYYGSIVDNMNQFSNNNMRIVRTEPVNAVAKLFGENVSGLIQFKQMPGWHNVEIEGVIQGLTPGLHGFHIHQFGDMRDGCKSMGGHYNPDGNNHGAQMDMFRHVGDLGNIQANENGEARFKITDSKITLIGPRSILGRGVVVHAKEDDLGRGNNEDSRKTGNAGGRVACGVVAVSN